MPWPVFVGVAMVLLGSSDRPVFGQQQDPGTAAVRHTDEADDTRGDAAADGQQHHPSDAHEMWSRPLSRSWQLIGMAQGYPLVSLAAAGQSELPINRTDVHFTQPAVMANLENEGGRVVLRTTLNFEGLTQRDGEVTFGAWGEGYLDSRHPHTLLHEAMLSVNLWEAGGGAFSLSAGRGFAPYGTDDPMSRPVQKYPTNHHLSQILERWTVNAVYLQPRWSVEAGLFGGTEPTGPWDIGNFEGFGQSWSTRVTAWLGGGAAPAVPWELSGSYGRVREFHEGHGTLTVLYNAAVRHARTAGRSTVYALGEFSVAEAEKDGRNFAALVESLIERGRHQPYVRLEYASRPEYLRDGAPGTEGFFRYDHDAAAIGATRWLISSFGYGHRLTGYPVSARPFVEVQHHRVRPERGGLLPEDLFQRSSFWSVSIGLRLFAGGEPMRMGRYGVLDPMTAMHRERTGGHERPPQHRH